jgi:hypothetical protein
MGNNDRMALWVEMLDDCGLSDAAKAIVLALRGHYVIIF